MPGSYFTMIFFSSQCFYLLEWSKQQGQDKYPQNGDKAELQLKHLGDKSDNNKTPT